MWFCLLDAVCVVWHCFSELCKCYSSLRDVGTCGAQPELLLSGTRDDPQSEEGSNEHVNVCNGCTGRFCCFLEFFLLPNTVIKRFLNPFYLSCDIASPVRTGLAAPSVVTFIAFVNVFTSLGLN